jgi:ubiquitin carboxyl-terminal hydrolase 36/42
VPQPLPLTDALQAPNVLVLHLKRFSALGGKITRGVTFEETLSLQPHMSETDEGAHYSLYSVVVHDGFSGASGVRCRATIWR